jgi:hypothetical protein
VVATVFGHYPTRPPVCRLSMNRRSDDDRSVSEHARSHSLPRPMPDAPRVGPRVAEGAVQAERLWYGRDAVSGASTPLPAGSSSFSISAAAVPREMNEADCSGRRTGHPIASADRRSPKGAGAVPWSTAPGLDPQCGRGVRTHRHNSGRRLQVGEPGRLQGAPPQEPQLRGHEYGRYADGGRTDFRRRLRNELRRHRLSPGRAPDAARFAGRNRRRRRPRLAVVLGAALPRSPPGCPESPTEPSDPSAGK